MTLAVAIVAAVVLTAYLGHLVAREMRLQRLENTMHANQLGQLKAITRVRAWALGEYETSKLRDLETTEEQLKRAQSQGVAMVPNHVSNFWAGNTNAYGCVIDQLDHEIEQLEQLTDPSKGGAS